MVLEIKTVRLPSKFLTRHGKSPVGHLRVDRSAARGQIMLRYRVRCLGPTPPPKTTRRGGGSASEIIDTGVLEAFHPASANQHPTGHPLDSLQGPSQCRF